MNDYCKHNHNCVQELKNDHEKILENLDTLQNAVKNETDKESVKKFLDFTRDFAEPHHHKEEEFLFPKLEEKGIPREGGPIGIMLLEHETKRRYVKNLSEAFTENNDEKIKENSLAIISLMRDHIYKENNILYPCAEDVLTPEELNAMGEKCSEIKGVKPCVLTSPRLAAAFGEPRPPRLGEAGFEREAFGPASNRLGEAGGAGRTK